jgi:hypothetical protein
MKKLTFSIIVAASALGCQSPATFYANGVLFWYSPSAIGIGYGEYTEVAAGGTLKRTLTQKDGFKSTLTIDNTHTATNGHCSVQN